MHSSMEDMVNKSIRNSSESSSEDEVREMRNVKYPHICRSPRWSLVVQGSRYKGCSLGSGPGSLRAADSSRYCVRHCVHLGVMYCTFWCNVLCTVLPGVRYCTPWCEVLFTLV